MLKKARLSKKGIEPALSLCQHLKRLPIYTWLQISLIVFLDEHNINNIDLHLIKPKEMMKFSMTTYVNSAETQNNICH